MVRKLSVLVIAVIFSANSAFGALVSPDTAITNVANSTQQYSDDTHVTVVGTDGAPNGDTILIEDRTGDDSDAVITGALFTIGGGDTAKASVDTIIVSTDNDSALDNDNLSITANSNLFLINGNDNADDSVLTINIAPTAGGGNILLTGSDNDDMYKALFYIAASDEAMNLILDGTNGQVELAASSEDGYLFYDGAGVDNTITVANSANAVTLTGIVDMGAGYNSIVFTDTASLDATKMEVHSTTDNDTIEFEVTEAATIDKIDLSNGGIGTTTTLILKNNNVALTVANGVVGGAGDDKLIISTAGSTTAAALTGNIDLGDGNNTFNFDVPVNTFLGNIMAGSGNDTITVDADNHNFTSGGINLGAGDNTINLTGAGIAASNITITGGIDVSAAGTTDMINLNNAHLVSAVTLGNGDELNILGGNDAKITGALIGGISTVNISAGSNLNLATDSNLSGTTLNFGIESDVSAASLNTGATTLTVDDATKIAINLTGASFISDGTDFTLIDSTGGTLTGEAAVTDDDISDNSAVLDFTIDAANNDNQIVVTSSRTAYSTVVANSSAASNGARSAALSLDGVDTTTASDTRNLLASIDRLATTAEVANAMQSLSGESQTMTIQPLLDAVTTYNNQMSARTSILRKSMADGTEPFAPACEEGQKDADDYSAWGNAIGLWGDQDGRGGYTGYEWDTYGGIIGLEKIEDNCAYGITTGYSNTNVDGDDRYNSDTDTFHIGAYGSYLQDKWYLDTGMSFAINSTDGERKINIPGLNQTAKSDYDSNAYSFYFGGGYEFEAGSWTLVPNAEIAYIYYDQDSYTEKDAAGANLDVKDYDQDSLTSTLGLDATYKLSNTLRATLRTAWIHEYCDNQATITSRIGSGSYVKTNGLDVADDTFVFGAGIESQVNKNTKAYLDCNYEARDKSDAYILNGGICIYF